MCVPSNQNNLPDIAVPLLNLVENYYLKINYTGNI